MRAPTLTVLCCCCLLASVPAAGSDVELGLETGVGYDTNPLLEVDTADEPNDWFVRVGPRFRAYDTRGFVQWQLRYFPRYQRYFDLSEASGWDHDAYAEIGLIGDRTQLTLSDRYLDYDTFSELADGGLDPDIDTGVLIGRERVRQNQASISVNHSLSYRTRIQGSYQRYDNEFERVNAPLSTSEVDRINIGALYQLYPKDVIGVSVDVTRQGVSRFLTDEVETIFYNVSGTWEHTFDPSLRFAITAGPSLVDGEDIELPDELGPGRRFPLSSFTNGPFQASTCPPRRRGVYVLASSCAPFPFFTPFPSLTDEAVFLPRISPDPDDEDLDYFARVELSKSWEYVSVNLSYTRDASTTTELSGTVRDVFAFGLNWRPARRWTITFDARYEIRDEPVTTRSTVILVRPVRLDGKDDVAEAFAFEIDEEELDFSVDGYFAGLYVNYEVAPRTDLFCHLTWTSDQTQSDFAAETEVERARIILGVRYTFSPIGLPF
jgi:hypothetical protein